ncbi:hypothetical protein HOLleu_45276 [Holothuria leucospilota]|uniref:Uncharacterized protein n=1 Tax=Holothuria leucospilota TaxID=206669 RepID=A0A9Q0YA18_HOLLE|nr:hypothetical protein HOLleu_45276 [Holothuria leucospilota]
MNDAKTYYFVLGSRQQVNKLNSHSIVVGSETIPCASSIKYLGVWLDSCLKFQKHITAKFKTLSHNLHCIGSFRSSLTPEACKVLIHGIVHSHVDYCNSLFLGISNRLITRLQRLQNYAS